MAKKSAVLALLDSANYFHVKSEWQQNSDSTPWTVRKNVEFPFCDENTEFLPIKILHHGGQCFSYCTQYLCSK